MTAILTLLFLMVMFAGCAATITFLFSVIAYIVDKFDKDKEDQAHKDYD